LEKEKNSKIKKEALRAIRKKLRRVSSDGINNQDIERQKVFWRRILEEIKRTSFA
jgi:transposase